MKQVRLNANVRTERGTAAAKRFRSAGKIPSVIYGESGVTHLVVDAHDFSMAWRDIAGRAALIELHHGGGNGADESQFAIIQEAQRNPRTDAFEHIDFKEIVRGKPMEADIPVITKGVCPGVKNGGILEVHADTLEVRCRPRDLPESITVDVTQLQIGKSIHVREITAPEGIEVLTDGDEVAVACVGAHAGRDESEDAIAEDAEPELVGKAKDDDDDGEGKKEED
ncbi:MAG: 50S ribosomal protein L25 [Opitutales bacterium]|nr:50S ribosomal protein L25 [Opitutales bacterium]